VSIFFLLLVGVSVSSAESGHSFIGYQFGYQSTQGDVTGNNLSVGLRGGFGVSSPLSVTLRGGLGSSGTYQLGAGAEYTYRHLGKFQPFLSAGYGFEAIKLNVTSDQDQVKLNGHGPDVGLGFDYFIRDRNSIGLGVTERFVHYRQPDDPRFRGGLDSRSTLINARWNVYF
jgi:opacity protein-like surface antigen